MNKQDEINGIGLVFSRTIENYESLNQKYLKLREGIRMIDDHSAVPFDKTLAVVRESISDAYLIGLHRGYKRGQKDMQERAAKHFEDTGLFENGYGTDEASAIRALLIGDLPE